jgi:hypothetical protein
MSNTATVEKDRQRTLAAIVGGVTAFMEEQERATQQMVPGRRPDLKMNLWAVFGREEIMRMRSMWQRRMACR